MYLDNAQGVIEVIAHFLFFLIVLFLLGGVLNAVVVNAKAKEHLHVAKAIVEVAETHLVETCKQQKSQSNRRYWEVRVGGATVAGSGS